jgi:branched-chain amino acid transport system permease protein
MNASGRPSPLRACALALGVAAFALLLDVVLARVVPDASLRLLLMTTVCNVLVAVSLNVINGLAGQLSIGHAGFVGVGAYTSAIVASQIHAHLGGGEATLARSFLVVPPALLAAAIVAGIFGFVVGLPSLRLRGDYLAIVTLGFAEIFRLSIASAPASGAGAPAWSLSRLGGPNGYAGPVSATLGAQGVPLYAGPFWIVSVVVLMSVLAWRLKFSAWGRALRALREDEIAAAAVGVDPTRYKVTSFVIAAVGGGVAGALVALMRDGAPTVQPDTFGFQASFEAITMVILGGSGSITGAALGAVVVTLGVKLIEYAQTADVVQRLAGGGAGGIDLNALRMIAYGALVIGLMIMRPEGLLGERELFAALRSRASRAPRRT